MSITKDAKSKMQAAIDHLKQELMNIRTDINSKPKALVAMVCRDFGDFRTAITVQVDRAREDEGTPEQ